MTPHYADDSVTLYHGDCLEVLRELPDASVDSIVTDPPYGLEFMGKDWDRPWAVTARASVGFEGREDNLTLPSHRDSRNANCRACGGRQRGAKRCSCPSPEWDRDPSADMREFGRWCEAWATECLRVLKPGGHLLAFGGTRTWHRLACAVEDAGFEIRDSIAWLYGSGFPKSLDVSKAIDKAAGVEREVTGTRVADVGIQGGNFAGATKSGIIDLRDKPATPDAERWQGWGTALKPAFEPVVVGRKPLAGTVAANVLEHGTGALNIDGCRVEGDVPQVTQGLSSDPSSWEPRSERRLSNPHPAGRWPANVVLDESQAAELDRQSGESASVANVRKRAGTSAGNGETLNRYTINEDNVGGYDDEGGASRFFPTFRYEAKAPTSERPRVDGIAHPTVKPLSLMQWLVRLVTPPGGTVLEPFAGSGTTAEACVIEGFKCIAIEREADYLPLIMHRLTKPIQVGLDFGGAP